MNDDSNHLDSVDLTRSMSIDSSPLESKGSNRLTVACQPNFGYSKPEQQKLDGNVMSIDQINEMAK
mgnify:CR=1 FL=1